MSRGWQTGGANRSDHETDILIAEPDSDVAARLTGAFTNAESDPTVHVVSDGDDALAVINGECEQVPRPNLVVLALQLPGTSGDEVLAALAADPELRPIPVIVLTDGDTAAAIRGSYDSHANACLQKSVDPAAVRELGASIAQFWLDTARLPPKAVE